jgi:DNA-binding XRE family transcriptional regulator
MAATNIATDDTPDATPRREVRLDFDVIDRRAAELGVDTPAALAVFLGVNKSTVWRFRNGRMNPGLGTAMHFAARLGLPVEQIAQAL